MNTLLIGARASGKTTVGRLLAAKLLRVFIDLDDRVLRDLGEPSVQSAWKNQGEPRWRGAEAAAIVELLKGEDQVIALGGGTPMIPAAKCAIESAQSQGTARVIYLMCSIDELARRLREHGGDRPNLTEQGLINEIASVVAAREPTYRQLAQVRINVALKSPSEIVAEIVAKVESR
ncbi:MAG: hypothetical protein L0219_00245 [Phycisphaerales bacterium]|nr:hypothetical protein [Phycisphaerales bacterium]MCI0675925.1 hypothetical protein [Phycisphaerales bacterium]